MILLLLKTPDTQQRVGILTILQFVKHTQKKNMFSPGARQLEASSRSTDSTPVPLCALRHEY